MKIKYLGIIALIASLYATGANAACQMIVGLGIPALANAPIITSITTPATVGEVFTANTGVWSNCSAGACTFAFQWNWQDTNTPIAGATASTYTSVAADVGHFINVTIKATNSAGTASATSACM